jgi:hypothetical protein
MKRPDWCWSFAFAVVLSTALASGCASRASTTSVPSNASASPGMSKEPATVAASSASPRPAAETKAPDPLAVRIGEYIASLPSEAREHATTTVFAELPAALVGWQSDGTNVYALVSKLGPVVESRDVLCGAPLRAASGSLLFDLRGDGGKSVVFAQVNGGRDCTNGTDVVYEFVADTWVIPPKVPEKPSEFSEAPAGATPSFPVDLFSFVMGEAEWAINGLWVISVVGWESWDGSAYSRRAAPHLEAYHQAYERSAAEARAAHGPASCTADELSLAAEIYVFGTLLGISEKELLQAADRVMAGRPTKPCIEGRARSWPSWAQVRASLRKARAEIAKLR